jgi:hypothetical protein
LAVAPELQVVVARIGTVDAAMAIEDDERVVVDRERGEVPP